MLSDYEQAALIARLDGWELVEFLQVSIEQVLAAALENDWIEEENIPDLLSFAGIGT